MNIRVSTNPNKAKAGQYEYITQQYVVRNMILSEKKGWGLYRRVSKLLLSPKEGWRRMKQNPYDKVQRPEKRASPWWEGLSSLP